jgi:hypothetical protein
LGGWFFPILYKTAGPEVCDYFSSSVIAKRENPTELAMLSFRRSPIIMRALLPD